MKFALPAVRRCISQWRSKAPISSWKFSTTIAPFSSEYKPMATATSDFFSPSRFEIESKHEDVSSSLDLQQSEYKSMATAVSDFLAPNKFEIESQNTASELDSQSDYKPLATATSDFLSPTLSEQTLDSNYDGTPVWSNNFSFASPESDFINPPRPAFMSNVDIEVMKGVVDIHLEQASIEDSVDIFEDEEFRNSTVYSLSLATNESERIPDPMSEIMRAQLEHVEKTGPVYKTNPVHLQNNKKKKDGFSKLPKFFDEDNINVSNDAIVVTETAAPFRIVTVNPAWENLCGFTKEESIGKTLSMLQGPETDKAGITALLSQVVKGEEAGMELTNYDKSGRKFQNRLRLGSLRDQDTNKITHFVGLLKEVGKSQAKTAAMN